MNHKPTGKVPGAESEDVPPFAPNHVGERNVDDEMPHRNERDIRAELHAVRDRPRYKRGCDDREHELVESEHLMRHRIFSAVQRECALFDAMKHKIVKTAVERAPFGKRKRVTTDDP